MIDVFNENEFKNAFDEAGTVVYTADNLTDEDWQIKISDASPKFKDEVEEEYKKWKENQI